jgi:hypothetical protein
VYTYRIVLDAYNSRSSVRGARVVTYSRGFNRAGAMRKIGSVRIASDGTVSDGLSAWPGTRNMPRGNVQERSLMEWEIVSIRSVPTAGKARIVHEYA